ncbi:hypothetical protein V1520DRAFT_381124 [Lipomyces starkeyi]|uniref:Uncharacterized protein n=1 Tax=Lipomyces starkeyi NRRL Y-11557 TaxID=675824 RepID=A0A1E3Q483_LIPST|nr:hypothetical protein LIPSTDRAFT_322303 [Lipomyces starkeyi NRRL Y-11557]
MTYSRVVKIYQLKLTVSFRKYITFPIEIQAAECCIVAISKMTDQQSHMLGLDILSLWFSFLLLTSPIEIMPVQKACRNMIHKKFLEAGHQINNSESIYELYGSETPRRFLNIR